MPKGVWNTRLRVRKPLAVRFWEKVNKTETCWLWTATHNGRGYGTILAAAGEEKILAHRASRELHYGPIPEGLVVCHHCDVRRCVRPDHLFLGTYKDNTQDMVQKGKHYSHFRGATHCIHGHPFDAANTRINTTGQRACRACTRERMRARRATIKHHAA